MKIKSILVSLFFVSLIALTGNLALAAEKTEPKADATVTTPDTNQVVEAGKPAPDVKPLVKPVTKKAPVNHKKKATPEKKVKPHAHPPLPRS